MSITGAGEAVENLQDYIDDYNNYKDNLTNVSTQYQNLYNTIVSKIEYANELKQRFYFLYFSTSSLAIDREGVADVIAKIKEFESPESIDDTQAQLIGLWEGFWGSVCGLAELIGLSYSFPGFLSLVLKVKTHNITAKTIQLLEISDLTQDKAKDLASKDGNSLVGTEAVVETLDQTTDVIAGIKSEVELTERNTSNRVSVKNVEQLDQRVADNVEVTIDKCSNLKRATSTGLGVLVLWFIGDLVTGAIEAGVEESDIEDKIDSMESDYALIVDGINDIESLHSDVCTYINNLLSAIDGLTSVLSGASIDVTYFDSSNSWDTLQAWSASTSDGQVSDSTTTLTFAHKAVDFVYTDSSNVEHKNQSYEYTPYQDNWSWTQTESDGSESVYSSYLNFADQASSTYKFLTYIKIWQNSYLESNTDAELTTIDTSDDSTDSDGSSNTAYTAFKSASVLLSSDVGDQTVTDDMYIAAWNASLDYSYDVEQVTSSSDSDSDSSS
jgi:hypothetical protein